MWKSACVGVFQFLYGPVFNTQRNSWQGNRQALYWEFQISHSCSARSQNCRNRLLTSSYLSVRLSVWSNLALTGRIFVKFGMWKFFRNVSRKFKFYCNLSIITGTIHEDQFTFMIIYRWILIRIRNISDKCRENQHISCAITFFPPKIVRFMR